MTGLTLTANTPILLGDYNGDGVVNGADYTVWRSTVDQTGVGMAADGDRDNTISSGDYNVWVANFGETASGSGALASHAVREPATLVLFLVGMSTMLIVRSTRRSR